MDPLLINRIRETLPPDLIYSLTFAGIIDRKTFLSITFDEDCDDGIRMADIVSYIRSYLPQFLPPSDLRRYLPVCALTPTLPDSSIVNNIKNWSLSPGYRYLIQSQQRELLSSSLEVESCEPSSKRRRLSESVIFDISAQDVSMREVAPPHSRGGFLDFFPTTAPENEVPQTTARTAVESVPNASVESREITKKPLFSIDDALIAQTVPEVIEVIEGWDEKSEQLVYQVKDKVESNTGRRNRRRGKRSRGRKPKSVSVEATPMIPKMETQPAIIESASTFPNGLSAGNHMIFNSDGEVVESRDVEVDEKTQEIAQKRKQVKQKPNFSTPGNEGRRVSFPHLSKSAQLKSRQSNASFILKQEDLDRVPSLNIPAFELKKNRKGVETIEIDPSTSFSEDKGMVEKSLKQKESDKLPPRNVPAVELKKALKGVNRVDIDSTTSSSTSSSEEEEEEEKTVEKAQEPFSKPSPEDDIPPPPPTRNYTDFPALTKPPEVGSLLCFRILELNTATLTPDFSDFKEGVLRTYEPHKDRCVIDVVVNKRRCDGNGKFDVCIESEDGILKNYELEESRLITSWSALRDTRLISGPKETQS